MTGSELANKKILDIDIPLPKVSKKTENMIIRDRIEVYGRLKQWAIAVINNTYGYATNPNKAYLRKFLMDRFEITEDDIKEGETNGRA